MKKSHLLGAVCACMFTAFVTPATAVTINYSNTAGSNIDLDPADNCGVSGSIGCFSFTTGNNIVVTSGTASGFNGAINGVFGVGAITTSGSTQTATVSGTGVLNIFDGSVSLTADLNWVDIASFGTGGILNTMGTANLTNIVYSGTNADLATLATAGSGSQASTFQFTSPMSLTDLFTASTAINSTSFSGSITAIPVPAAVWLFGSGLLGLVGVARRKKVA